MTNIAVQLKDLSKEFGNITAVDALNVDIEAGEFFGLLGPSGCGKTTTLRMIAGLETPTSGEIYVRSRPITNVPVHKRNIGMVFQDYGLFPHQKVYDNIAFGLRMKGWREEKIRPRVKELLALIQLPDIADRYPQQLSGGQQQRVALARSLAPRPTVLLLDEPMSNLDAKLRQELRLEFRAIQKELGITTIFVTHDQAEALSLSDRVLVMKQGRAVQAGTPREIYARPHTGWIASFLGDANLFHGQIRNKQGERFLVTDGGAQFRLPGEAGRNEETEAEIAMRPEDVYLSSIDEAPTDITGSVYRSVVENYAYEGSNTRYVLRLGQLPAIRIIAAIQSERASWTEGAELYVVFPCDKWILLNDASESTGRPNRDVGRE